MFVLDFAFKDDLSKPAYFFMKKLSFKVGATSECDLQIADLKTLGFDILITRGIGSQIKISTIGNNANNDLARLFKGTYENTAEIDIPTLSLKIKAIDIDCYPNSLENYTESSSKIFRKIVSKPKTDFPVLFIYDSTKSKKANECLNISLHSFSEIIIGRNHESTIQLNNDDISGTHAKIEFINNSYYLTDLNSTNGTYINSKPVNQKIEFKSKDLIVLGGSTVLKVVNNSEEMLEFRSSIINKKDLPKLRRYPVVLTNSELVQPRRIVLPQNKSIVVGRDPECDVWIGVPSVSREHCYLTFEGNQSITIKDASRNGTFTASMNLSDGSEHLINKVPEVIFFDNNIFLVICFDEKQEEIYKKSTDNIKLFLNHFGINSKEVGRLDSNRELELDYIERGNRAKNYILSFAAIGFVCVVIIIISLVWSLFL